MQDVLSWQAVSLANRISDFKSYMEESIFSNFDTKDYGEIVGYLNDEIERFRNIDKTLSIIRMDIDRMSRMILQWLDTMEGKRYELIEKVNVAEGKTSNFNPIGFVDQSEGIYNDIAAANDEGEMECIPVTEPSMYSYMSLINILKDSEKNTIKRIRDFATVYVQNQIPSRMDWVLRINRKILEALSSYQFSNALSSNDADTAKEAVDKVHRAIRAMNEKLYSINRWILQISKVCVATETNYDLYEKAVSVVSDITTESFQDVDGIYGWGSI